jgi:type IV secretory pathway VirB10-like protein
MSKAVDNMHPDASPANTRRVNNIPMYIFIAILCAFVIIVGLVAMDRAEKQNRTNKSTKENKANNANMFAHEIAGDLDSGLVAPLTVPEAPKTPEPTEALQIARPDNLDVPPQPPASKPELKRTPRDDERDRIRLAKLQQLDEAIRAKTGVKTEAPRSTGSSMPNGRDEALAKLIAARQRLALDAATGTGAQTDPTTAYKERLKQIQEVIHPNGTGEGANGSTPNNNYEQFAGGQDQGDRWKLNQQTEAPRTPYELRAGFVLPATLISGINSELPGQIMAQVSQDVFDTATGKWRLIPQGSRLVGSYSSAVSYGQSRVLVAWQRIVFPDGKAMDIGAMPGGDSAGYAGFTDQVNNHLARLYGSAILMSAVTAGFSMSQPQSTTLGTTAPTASSALSQALGQQLGQVTSQMIAKNMNTSPTLEIRPGYRFNVIVTKDLTFSKPYKAFDY